MDQKSMVANAWVWDEEMVEVVRRGLGGYCVWRLGKCFEHEGDEVVGKADGKEEEVVARVRIGGSGEENEEGMYDLRGMMDEDMLAKLRDMNGGAEVFTLRKDSKTWSAHAALEKLKNYVHGNEA